MTAIGIAKELEENCGIPVIVEGLITLYEVTKRSEIYEREY